MREDRPKWKATFGKCISCDTQLTINGEKTVNLKRRYVEVVCWRCSTLTRAPIFIETTTYVGSDIADSLW